MSNRSRSTAAPMIVVIALVGALFWMPHGFISQKPAVRGADVATLAGTAAAAYPLAAHAADLSSVPDLGSSMEVAGTIEPLMFGLVLGLCPTTLLGLMVAAWLQFKKGPTLGV